MLPITVKVEADSESRTGHYLSNVTGIHQLPATQTPAVYELKKTRLQKLKDAYSPNDILGARKGLPVSKKQKLVLIGEGSSATAAPNPHKRYVDERGIFRQDRQ